MRYFWATASVVSGVLPKIVTTSASLMRASPSKCFLAKAPCPTMQIFIAYPPSKEMVTSSAYDHRLSRPLHNGAQGTTGVSRQPARWFEGSFACSVQRNGEDHR